MNIIDAAVKNSKTLAKSLEKAFVKNAIGNIDIYINGHWQQAFDWSVLRKNLSKLLPS